MTKPMPSSAYTDSRRSKTARKYVTHCKVCLTAVYGDEPYTWRTNPMGISHDACVTP